MEGKMTFSKFSRRVISICDAAFAEGGKRLHEAPLR